MFSLSEKFMSKLEYKCIQKRQYSSIIGIYLNIRNSIFWIIDFLIFKIKLLLVLLSFLVSCMPLKYQLYFDLLTRVWEIHFMNLY